MCVGGVGVDRNWGWLLAVSSSNIYFAQHFPLDQIVAPEFNFVGTFLDFLLFFCCHIAWFNFGPRLVNLQS